MLPQTAAAALATQTEASARPSTRLRGTRLAIARTLWVAVTLLSVLLFAVAISVRVRQLQDGITGVGQPNWNAAGEVVLNPIAGGPADRAGIRPGDVLVAVDGRRIRAGLPLGLTGASGTQVRVAVRTGDGPVREYTITRVHQFAGALSQLGLSIPFYAGYHIALDILTMFGFLLAALLIVWRRSDDWLALLVALMLVVLGVRLPMDTSWISNLLGVGLYLPGSLLYDLGAFLALLFFLLFPDGKFVPRWSRALALWGTLNFFIASIDAFARQVQGSTVLYSFYGNHGFVYFPSWGLASLAYYRMPERWRVPRWLGALAIYALTWGAAYLFFPPGFRPDDAPDALNILFTAITYFILAYAQIARYRRVSSPVERQQTKWVVFGATVGLVGYFGYQTLSNSLMTLRQDTLLALYFEFFGYLTVCLALLVFAFSFGVAILRHRLWDIDILINRALVYTALTTSVAGVYIGLVVILGALFQSQGSLPVSLLATGGVAVLFQPLRDHLQRGVNRLLYGERDEPYSVLTRLGQRLETTLAPDAVLPTVVQTVREALKLPYVAVALATSDDSRPTTEDNSPAPIERTFVIVAAAGTPTQQQHRLPLVYQHEVVGQLLLAPRAPNEPFTPADQQLLANLARQAGVAASAVRLTSDLQRAREQLVLAREEERRRLRRDLHDGLGPALAAQTLKVGSARALLARDPAAADRLLTGLETDIAAALADIRRLVYNLRPPALDELGLVGTIRQHAAQYCGNATGTLTVTIAAPDRLPPLPAAVEVAAYRIAQEALNNVVKHAHAHTCRLQLSLTGGLSLEITDDGVGLPDSRHVGVGLHSMRERAEELGGTCVIEPALHGGTRVRAQLPLPH